MIVVVHKKDGESNERCITRFNKRVQASRKIMKVRKERYNAKAPTRRQVRAGAVMRDFYRAKKAKKSFY
jgi:hypothetical protein